MEYLWSRGCAPQSLVKLTGNLDDLRRRYAEFVAAYTVDSSTFDSLGASEGALASTLSQDRAGFTHAEGPDWSTNSQDDLQAMSSTTRRCSVDRQRKDGARKFGDDSATLSQIVKRMGTTEIYVAPRDAAVVGAGAATGIAHSALPVIQAAPTDSGTVAPQITTTIFSRSTTTARFSWPGSAAACCWSSTSTLALRSASSAPCVAC